MSVLSVHCPRCRAEVREDDEAVLRALAGGGAAVRCRSCKLAFTPGLDASSITPVPGGSRAAEPGSMIGSPPFPSLGAGSGDAPPFEPRSPEPAPKPRTLLDRWNALSPRRQKQVLGTALAVMAFGVLAWPVGVVRLPPPAAAKEEYPPRPADPPRPVEVVRVVDGPKPEYRTFFVAVGPIAEDTQLTDENFDHLFESHQALTVPPEAVGSKGDALGNYLQRPLGPGQVLTRSALGPTHAPRAAPPATAPMPREVREPGPDHHVLSVLTATGTRMFFYERRYGGNWMLLREQFLPSGGRGQDYPGEGGR